MRKALILVFTLMIAVTAIVSMGVSVEAKNIIKGDTQSNVRLVQQRLADLGYYKIKVDGIWGSRTNKAVRDFQRDYGLSADGIVGNATEKALKITLGGNSNNSGNTSNSGAGSGAGSGSNISSNDLNLLARCIYGESRGEPYTGQVAVAAVVLNRIKSAKFPNSVSGVIYQPGAFTAVNDGQMNLKPNDSAFNAARDAMNGWDPTNGCLYYYNPATATSKWIWSLKVELKIGRHSFARA